MIIIIWLLFLKFYQSVLHINLLQERQFKEMCEPMIRLELVILEYDIRD